MSKCATVSAIERPSRCCEISMWIGFLSSQQCGIINNLPCQKDSMKGSPLCQKLRGMSLPTICQRVVARTKRIYCAPSQHERYLAASVFMKRLTSHMAGSTVQDGGQPCCRFVVELQFVEFLVEPATSQ